MSRIRNITTALAAVLLTAPAFAYDIAPVNDTKMSVYGFVYALGQYFNGPLQSGVGSITPGNGTLPANFANAPDQNILFSVTPSRFGWASTTSNTAFGDISSKLEVDLNGGTASTAFHMRHAYASVGNLTFGHTWSTWNDLDAAIDEVDWAGPVGNACYDTPRRPLLRYNFTFDKMNSLAIALENNRGLDGDVYTGATEDGKIPTFAAAYTYADSWGHIGLRGLAITHGAYIAPTAAVAAGTVFTLNPKTGVISGNAASAATSSDRFKKTTTAFMLSGDVKFGKNDLVYSVYTGSGLGDYGYGVQSAQLIASTQTVNAYKSTGFSAGYTQVFTPMVRGNLGVSGVIFKKDTFVAASDVKQQMDFIANVFFTLNPKTQVGIEYFYETAKAFGSDIGTANPWLDKNLVATDKNNSSKLEVVLQAKF